MRRLAVLAVVLVALIATVVAAQTLQIMPTSLSSRWLTSLQASEGWTTPGYDTDGWRVVTYQIPAAYPNWMTPADQALHRFMWHPAGANRNNPTYFRRQLWVSGQVTQATLKTCADDQFVLFVNGAEVAREMQAGITHTSDVAALLKPGANVVAVEAMDTGPWGWGLLVAGAVTQEWPFDPERPVWVTSPTATAGWADLKYDDRAWQPAVVDPAPPIVLQGGSYTCFAQPWPSEDFSMTFYRRTLDLDGLPTDGRLTVLADDGYELYVNGRLVALEKRVDLAYRPVIVDVSEYLHPGRNLIAAKVTNTWGPSRFHCVPTVRLRF